MQSVYICEGVRTPIGRYGGALSSVRADDLAAHVLGALATRLPTLPKERIDDVVFGCANQAGEDNRNVARMASLLAGYPESVSGRTVNRLCGSGMDAISIGAQAISCGQSDCIVAGGVESMSRAPFIVPKSETAFSRLASMEDTTLGWRLVNPKMHELYGTDAMPQTAENVAEEYSISRSDQDALAALSQSKAKKAEETGFFIGEIEPVSISVRRKPPTLVTRDEHPRPQTSIDTLSKLATPFRDNGTVTAGNSSGVNDGACAVLLASGAIVEEFGLQPMAKISGTQTAGVAPRVMGIGPVPATRKLLEKHGLTVKDIGLWEVNEAFAAQAIAVMRELGLSEDAAYINPHGGAIALGHPLGMTGARLILTAARTLKESDAQYAVCTMCIGVGQGISMLIERIDGNKI